MWKYSLQDEGTIVMSVTRRGAIIFSGLGLVAAPQSLQAHQSNKTRNFEGTETAGSSIPSSALDTSLSSQLSNAADPITYLDNVCLLCEFPVREKGESLWPQGISINKADNEIYVSNSNGPATVLRLDVRDLKTGVRKSSKQLTVSGATWSEGIPWFRSAVGDLCFVVRTTPQTGSDTTYNIYNYTKNTIGSAIAIKGPFKADVNGDTFVTSDAFGRAATRFFIYSWASIRAGTPSLLATVPVENPAQDIGKTQAVAVVGAYLYILTGEKASNPGILVYDFTGKLVTVRDYAKADFRATVNTLRPGYLTSDSYVCECEGATNLDGKLVTGQIVVNDPALVAAGKMLVLQHNCLDGTPIKSRPLASFVRDTGWVTLPLALGWKIGGVGELQARRIGNQVFLRGNAYNALAPGNTWAGIATVPTGMRPAASTQFPQSSNTTVTLAVRINPGGGIECWSSAATGAWRILNGITYLID